LPIFAQDQGQAPPPPPPDQQQSYPPQQPGYPSQQPGYPPQQQQSYPPQQQQQPYPPQNQYPPQQPPAFTPAQLDQIVARIALYPDPLLAQILAGATYPDQIPDAARWADQHHYLTGQALADAIQADQLPFDPSVQALLPFPSVLDMMASDIRWTTDLGNAFLANQQSVMDAVQDERRRARDYGYLRSNPEIIVGGGPYITIMPVNPGYIVVPYYDPRVVFFAPRPGFVVGAGIRFGFGISIGGFFRPWGWGYNRFDWGGHALFINNARWGRTWYNRGSYVHPYVGVRRYAPAQRALEHHELEGRSANERQEQREGRRAPEEHRGGDRGGDHGHDRR
jgi:hypothetical protein